MATKNEIKAVSKEIAIAEVNKWLEFKKISSHKIEEKKDSIDELIQNIEDGLLVLNEDFSFTQTLKFPIGEGDVSIKTLTYKPRINVNKIKPYLQTVKPTDVDGRYSGYIAALTSQSLAIVDMIDTEDNSLARTFAGFFI